MAKEPKRKRGGSKPKDKCSKGHDISVVGRTKAGNCKKCQADYYKERWEYVRNTFKKTP